MDLKFSFLLLISFIIGSSAYAQAPDLKFKHLSTKQGLSQSSVTCILQDSRGFLWFGTQDGLNKYDGYRFTVYKNDDSKPSSISNSRINDLLQDKEGNLWIATDDMNLNRYDYATDSFIRIPVNTDSATHLNQNGIRALYEDPQANLWIATFSGLKKMDKKGRFVHYMHRPEDPESLSDNAVTAIQGDEKGNIWVGTVNGGLDFFDPIKNTFTHHQHVSSRTNSLSHNYVRCLLRDSKGNLWVGTDEGLNLLNKDDHSFTRYYYPPNITKDENNRILSLEEDGDQRIWIGTELGSLLVLDPEKNIFYPFLSNRSDPDALDGPSVYSIYRDRNNSMWTGTFDGGVNWVDRNRKGFKHFKKNASDEKALGTNFISCFAEDKKQQVWIGTGKGLGLYNKEEGTFTHYRKDPENKNSISSNSITALIADEHDNLWVGTWGGGLNKLSKDRKTFTHYMNEERDTTGIRSNFITSLSIDQEGVLWIGTEGSGLSCYHLKNNQFIYFKNKEDEPKSLSSDGVTCVFTDSRGDVWIGTSGSGLNQYNREHNNFIRYQQQKDKSGSISSNYILTIFEDKQGYLWFGTSEGLNLFDPSNKKFTLYNDKHGLPSNTIKGIQQDKSGNLWISSNNGISKFNPESGFIRNYTPEDGLQGLEFRNGSLQASSGELYFCGINGFNVFHPDYIKDNPLSPPVYLTNFQVFNKEVAIGGEGALLKQKISETKEVVLSYQESVFSFEFAALGYSSPEKNQYAYMMEGFDKDWNYVGTQRKATYTNLDPGKYTFRVKASNNDGLWNEKGTALSLIVTPPFWKTWWFRSLFGLAVLGSAFTFYQVRMSTVKEQKEELEKQVKEKTADIQKANNDLIERQEEILQQQEELQMQAETLQAQAKELQKTNEHLRHSQEEIAVQRDHLKIVNEQVMSSIQYARTIQTAILPSHQKIAQAFPEHFIIYRPKDVVSGDFYWFSQLSKEDSGLATDFTFLAVVDCTGHGVPGAFMSIIGSTLLNEIISQKQITDPAQILENLHQGVKQALEKSEGVNTAGMDVCLCRFEELAGRQEVKVLYSGAKRNLLFAKAGTVELGKLLADRRSIGSDSSIPFKNQELILAPGSMLYLTSDGYADQNNMAREKIGTRTLYQLIGKNCRLSSQEQKRILESTLDSHQQGTEQRDDITIVGVNI